MVADTLERQPPENDAKSGAGTNTNKQKRTNKMPTKQRAAKTKKPQLKVHDLNPKKNPRGGVNQKGTASTGTELGGGKAEFDD